jgi:hypothetical protein
MLAQHEAHSKKPTDHKRSEKKEFKQSGRDLAAETRRSLINSDQERQLCRNEHA